MSTQRQMEALYSGVLFQTPPSDHEVHSRDVPIASQIPTDPPYLAPVNRLPNELLQGILLLAASEDEEPMPYCISPIFCGIASTVCRKWRDVVVETSEFWTNVDYSEGPSSHTALNVQRARNRPLTLKYREDHDAVVSHHHVMQIPTAVLSQTGRLNLHAPPQSVELLLSRFQNSLGETASFHSISIDAIHTHKPFAAVLRGFFGRLRELRRLVLKNMSLESLLPIGPSLLTVELRSISKISLVAVDSFLRACPQLESLVFMDCNLANEDHSSDTVPYILPMLLHLALYGVDSSLLRQMYSTIRAPALCSLLVDMFTMLPFANLGGFIENSPLLFLESIEIHRWRIHHQRLLSMLPTIRKVYIHGGRLSYGAFDRLTPGKCCGKAETCTHYSCPKLSEIYFQDIRGCSPVDLLGMVEGRAATIDSRIHIVKVKGCHPPEDMVKPLMEIDRVESQIRAYVPDVEWDWILPSL
jgi:hypothetical protein